MTSAPDDKGELSGKTIPQTSIPRTMTVSKRPWTLIVVFILSSIFVITFAVARHFTKTVTPSGTINKLVTAFKNGDVEMLMTDPELNFRERALKDIEKRGLEEYNKVDAAFDQCLEVGLDKYRKLKSEVMVRGEEAYKDLSQDEQKYVKALSKNEWIFSRGMEEIAGQDLMGVEDPAVFFDEEKGEAFIQTLLGKQEGGETPADKGKGKKKTAKKGQGKGGAVRDAFEELRKKVYAAGSKAFLALPREERDLLERKSRMDFVIREGMKGLSQEDLQIVRGPEIFAEGADENVEAAALCIPLVSLAQQELLKGKDYKDFISKKDHYIMKTGREKYEKFLQALFGQCSYEIAKTKAYGKDLFDIIRVSRAAVELRWKGCKGVETFIPPSFMLELREGKWRIIDEPEPFEAEHEAEIKEPPPGETNDAPEPAQKEAAP
jgi:hypothetical protein